VQDPHPPAQPGVAGPGALAAVREARQARAHQALQARLRDLEQLLPGLPDVRAWLRASPVPQAPPLSRRALPGCAGFGDTAPHRRAQRELAPCALVPAWPASYARLAQRLYFSSRSLRCSLNGASPCVLPTYDRNRASFPLGPQAARFAALLELRRLRAAGAQRRLCAAVRAEAARTAAGAPAALADWGAWRRAAPGAPDLAPPRPPPPPPRAGQLAPAELAALQTEMSRCGKGAGSALSQASDERARGPGAPRLSVLACPGLTGGARPPPAGLARWRRGRGRRPRRARRRRGARRPRRRPPRKLHSGARPWRSWRGAAATQSWCAFACTPLLGAVGHCVSIFGGNTVGTCHASAGARWAGTLAGVVGGNSAAHRLCRFLNMYVLSHMQPCGTMQGHGMALQ